MRTAIASLLVAVPISLFSRSAAAEPRVTIGASAGLWQNEEDAHAGVDSSQTLGLWGRLGLTKRLSGQLELAEHKSGGGDCGDFCTFSPTTIRSMTALLVVDLKDSGKWMPILMAGVGLDRDESELAFPSEATHIEGGLGIEYRAEGGLTFGADVRLGGRSVENGDVILDTGGRTPILPAPGVGLREGEYRAARLTLGVRF
jgi:hypothetical protein